MNTEARAREVLSHVLSSKESAFYRNKYDANAGHVATGGLPWSALPFLNRAEIQQSPFEERLYAPEHHIDVIRPTSGTSGAGVLLMPRQSSSARKSPADIFRKHYEFLGVHKILSFSGAQFLYADTFRPEFGIDMVAADAQELSLALSIVEQYHPDMLMGFAYVLERFAGLLTDAGLTKNIRAIQIFGEWLSNAEWEHLKESFPNAYLSLEYASIDAQTLLAMPCTTLLQEKRRHLHPIPEFVHLELIDSEGSPITEEGKEGEIVITVLRDVAFPLIRYRTGDAAIIVSHSCHCGTGTPVLEMRGRLAEDRVRFYGGEISIVEISRALEMLAPQFATTPHFTVRYREEKNGTTTLPELYIETSWNESVLAESFAHALAQEIRVRPGYTYAMGVESGAFVPLRAKNMIPTVEGGKRQRILRT